MNPALAASPVPAWCTPPDALSLGCDEIHVWRTTLDQTPSRIQTFLGSLGADERARAERFYFERDREHFVVARGVLRAILGRYANRPPERLSFRYSTYGKPSLAGDFEDNALRFNLSHSRGIALYAIARGREVGIDLERVRSDLAVAEIAEQFFSAREIAMLRALPAQSQHEAFFHCWTRKEACIKARGEGLSLPLDRIDVCVAPQADSSDGARWSLRGLIPAPGYVAAVAAEGSGWRLAFWQWPDEARQANC